MKKLILTALLSGLIYSFGICQGPTLFNYNFVPKINVTTVTIKVDTTNVEFKNTAANFVWDYSSLFITDTKVYNSFCVDPETPFISSFPNATIAIGGTNSYSYFYADTNEYTWLGIGTLNYLMVLTDPLKYCTFPFSYGNQMIDSFYSKYLSSSKSHFFSGYNSLIADGWGTLKLPKNTYSNTLRTKLEQYTKDSTDGINTESYNTVISWYDGNNIIPLLKITTYKRTVTGNPTPTFGKAVYVADFTDIVTITPSENSTSVNIYPNPANKEVNIELNVKQRANINIWLIDLFGNIVRPIDAQVVGLGKYQNTIDISDLPKGMYAVKIIAGQEVLVKRIVIQ